MLIKDNKMIEFLSSKNVSLGCAVINVALAGAAVMDANWLWAAISTGLAVFCYINAG
jgi:hypothetical protein